MANALCHHPAPSLACLPPPRSHPRASFRFSASGSSPFCSVKACVASSRSVGAVFSSRVSGDSVEIEVTTELEGEILSGEWPENFSMLNYEDLSAHYESVLFKAEALPDTFLADVMSTTIYTARANQLLVEVDSYFSNITGLPVIDEDLRCIGVLSKKDKTKASRGLNSTVGEIMTSPAITLSADKTVKDAAVLMLKNKIHRIPIVNDSQQVVGIVTRTDIFTALEGGS